MPSSARVTSTEVRSARLRRLSTNSVLALMPTFETIGILAPIAVMAARLVQGFSAGGEFGSSTAFLVEHMPERRGFVASWQFASQGVSGLLGAGFGALLTSLMSPEDLQSWGWRLPFLFGVLIGPVGIYIRNHVDDATPPPAAEQGSPVKEVFAKQMLPTILAIGALAVGLADNFGKALFPEVSYFTLYAPMALILAIKPTGLFGRE